MIRKSTTKGAKDMKLKILDLLFFVNFVCFVVEYSDSDPGPVATGPYVAPCRRIYGSELV
jgi:hypothetical protein